MKYIYAGLGAVALRCLLWRLDFRGKSRLERYNLVIEASNRVLRRVAVYDDTMWVYWPGWVDMPSFCPAADGDTHVPGVGWCATTWIKPRRFCRASQW